jgi:hypothetical protein
VVIPRSPCSWRRSDRYESSAELIVPRRIPEAYVRSAVSTRLDERLMA